ncbi:MAG: protoporphyrinogen oxidase [Acidithiobacillales bacterium]
MAKSVVIVGGGVTGLVAAFRRASPGATLVLEADGRLGGSVRTLREGGFVLETGPNTLRTTAAADRLIADLGLAADLVFADRRAPRWIFRGGRPRAIVPGPKGLFNTVLSTRAKLRLLGDLRLPRRPSSLEDESVRDFFIRRFGEEAATYGAGPMVSGVYAGDPAALSVRSAFPHLWEAEARSGSVIRGFIAGGLGFGRRAPSALAPPDRPGRRHRARTVNFTRGLFQMVEALAARLASAGARIETNAAAVRLEGPRPGQPGRCWSVLTKDGRSFDADTVVLTLEPEETSRLLGERLSRSGAALSALPVSPVATVIFAFRPATPEDAPKGFGVLVPRGEGIRSLGILYPASLFAGRAPEGIALTTSFLGGALDPEIAAAEDPTLTDLALSEVRRLHKGLARCAPERTWITRWPKAIPQMPLGHFRTMAALDEDLASIDQEAGEPGTLILTGGWRDGIALGKRIERGEAIGRML